MCINFVYQFFGKWFTGDSENDLKINIFLEAGESDVDVDADADTDVVFKDPAQDQIIKFLNPPYPTSSTS